MSWTKNIYWGVSSLGSIQCTFLCYLIVWSLTTQPKVDKGLLQCYTKNKVCLLVYMQCVLLMANCYLITAVYNV